METEGRLSLEQIRVFLEGSDGQSLLACASDLAEFMLLKNFDNSVAANGIFRDEI